MKEKTKEFIKKYLIGFILGFVSVGIVAVYAETYFPSNDVTYDNSESGLSSTDVQGAIDELYGVCTTEPAGEQIIKEAGLEKDPYECRYFFTGANPNNYITFNDEKAGWRIISVECDGTIKIMKTADINISNNLAWDSSNSNNWTRPASLNTYLNGTYYNGLNITAQNQIVAKDWSIGDIISDNNNLADQVNDENAVKWNGKVALVTLSEYIRTNSNRSSCGSFSLNNDNRNYRSCRDTTWMYNSSLTQFTLSSYSVPSGVVFRVTASGDFSTNYASTENHAVRPVVYLSSEVKITGGDGSQANPYTIA